MPAESDSSPSPDWTQLFSSGRYYPILDCVFCHLSVADYITLRRVSRSLRNLDHYVSSRFWSGDVWLRRFVTDPRYFRQRLFDEGAIIAGSCLLSFFAFQRSQSEARSLDVYVETRPQAESLESVLLYEQYAPLTADSGHDRDAKQLVWRRQAREIRLHVTARPPLLAVLLSAQTTACINFVSGDKAYCMFPRLTFVHHKVLPLQIMSESVGTALREIEHILGWGTENVLWPDHSPSLVSRASGPRRVGDGQTLVVPLGDNISGPLAESFEVENHQFHVSKDRFGGRRPSRARGHQMNLLELDSFTPLILAQELSSPALSGRCLTGSPLWRSFLSDRLRRWAYVEMCKAGHEQVPINVASDIIDSMMAGVPDDVEMPESWRYADGQIQLWWDEWYKEEAAKQSYRDAPR
ncbi:hypothetical protein Micbo1qcDRAFT_235748 [Microdochium bolleyi]|uniref:F-box domain-containing protein n=1 Tax=Microdochium bolleyi TaxID=196109 RepID=A0A136IU94_9PEZI|nr:hypothetical protein Micbo1qcDRAFT_235748 [Microdochium bolleyi]